MNFTQLVRILWARRRLVVGITAAALVLSVLANLVMPDKYVATTSLLIDTRGVDPLTGANGPAQQAAALLATQIDVLTSRAVALQVVDALDLTQTPGEAGRSRESWANSLLNSLTVKPAADSNVVRLKFEDTDPKFAADAANGFATAYLQKNMDLKTDPARRQSEWFDKQMQGMRDNVGKERENLSEYQRKNGIVAADERLDVENARLEDLNTQLVAAQRDVKEAQARLRQASEAVDDGLSQSPDLMSNGLLQSMKGDLVRAESRMAEVSARYGRNHPQYIAASSEVNNIKEKIAAEMQRAKGSLHQALQIAQMQEASLQRSFDEQKTGILKLKRQRDELTVRSREVDNAQGAYDQAMQRAAQLRLESQFNQTTVAILDSAIAPLSPAGLGLFLTAALAVVLGSMLGGALALGLEMFDRRIRAGDELSQLSGIEVLAEIPHLRASFKSSRPRLLHGRKVLEIEPV
jgi:chain length determinant protein EpsF